MKRQRQGQRTKQQSEKQQDARSTEGARTEEARGRTILIVEDEADVRQLFRIILEGAGFVVREADDGVQAVDLLQTWPVDAILLDLSMPHMNGIQVLENLVAIGRNVDAPVLVATAMSDPDLLAQAREAGAVEILRKPFPPDVLIEAVHRCLSSID